MIHKPSLESLDVPQKIWARSVQPFWRLLDTNKQTDRQTKFIFKEFEPRFKSAKTRFKLSAGLNLETFDKILSGTSHISAAA